MTSNIQTIENIRSKLDWGIRCLNKIKKSKHEKLEIQDNFWSFLTSFHSAWFYYNHLIALMNPTLTSKQRSRKSIEVIEHWKINKLSPNQRKSWEVLNKIRNNDTHVEPIKPEVIEREVLLVNDIDQFLTDEEGRILSLGSVTKYYIYFENSEYDIIELADEGIGTIESLLVLITTLA